MKSSTRIKITHILDLAELALTVDLVQAFLMMNIMIIRYDLKY